MKYYGTISNDYDIVNKGYVDANIPTQISQLENDSGYATTTSVNTGLDTKVSKTGDTMTGVLTISNVGSTATATSIASSGNILAGGSSKTSYTLICTIRKCSADGNNVNTSTFFTNSDGSSKFCHKRGSETGDDDAYMLFDATGFRVAYSGTKGTKATVEYAILDANTGYIRQTIDDKDAAILTSANNYTDTQISGLATVASSGSYNDLTNKPTIPPAYTLPTASSDTLGGVKVGSGLSIASGVLSASITSLASFGITASATELNYVKGVTSAIQTQLNNKANKASPAFTGTPTAPTPATSTNSTQIATTAYVKANLSSVGGVAIAVQSSQPSGQKSGDFWFQVV